MRPVRPRTVFSPFQGHRRGGVHALGRSSQAWAPWLFLVVFLAFIAVAGVLAVRAWRSRRASRADLKKAELLYKTGQYAEARRLYEEVLRRGPDRADLLLRLARCHLGAGGLAEARSYAGRAAKQGAGAEAYILLAQVNLVEADAEVLLDKLMGGKTVDLTAEQREALNRAAARAEDALNVDAASSAAHQVLAQAHKLVSRDRDALRYARRAVELAPKSADARVLLAQLLVIEGQPKAALEECRRAIGEPGKANPGLVQLAARLYVILNRHEQAEALLARLLSQQRADPRVRLELATCYLDSGQYERALKHATRVVNEYQGSGLVNTRAHRLRGIALARLGRYGAALPDLQSAAIHMPEDWWGHYWLGRALAETGETEQARDALLAAVRARPSYMPARQALAELYEEEGDLASALEQFQDAVAARPDDPERRRALVDFCLRHDLEEQAEEQLREILRLPSPSPEAARTLAELFLRWGNPRLALQLANYALDLAPEDRVKSLLLRARALAALGQVDAAAAQFARLVQQRRTFAKAYVQWAAMYEDAGRRAAAEGVYARALAAAPKHRKLRRAYATFCAKSNAAEQVRRGLKLLRTLLEEQPTDLGPRVALIDHYLAADALEDALSEAKAAVDAVPEHTGALALLARVRRRRREWPELLETLERITRLDPQDFAGYQRAAATLRLGDGPAALAVVRDAAERFPKHRRRIELERAVVQFFAGRGSTAIDGLKRRLATVPSDGEAAYLLALMRLANRDAPPDLPPSTDDALPPAALAGWQDLMELRKERPGIAKAIAPPLLKAFVYANAGWHRTAARTCHGALDFAEDALLPRLLAVMLWDRAGERQKAIQLCRGYLSATGSVPAIYHLLGDLLALEGDLAEARSQYAKAVSGDSENAAPPQAPAIKGALLADALGDRREAISHWRAFLRRSPENAVANNNLAWLLAQRREGVLTDAEASEARGAVAAATAAASGNPQVLDTAGWLQSKLGEGDRAIEGLEQARAAAPYRAAIHFHLGMAYARFGKSLQAERALEQAVRLDPGAAFVERARQTLAALRY